MAPGITFNKEVIQGIEWNGLSTLATSIIQSVQVAALSYFLPPTAFGIMAMAMVAIGFAQAYNDIGVSNAVIQRQDITTESLSSLYWMQIALGFMLFILILLITPLTAQFFSEPSLTGVMTLTGLIFLVSPLGQLFQILMQKGMEFKTLAIIDITASALSLVVAVITAYLGFGVLALVLGQLVFYSMRSVQFYVAGHRRWKIKYHFRYSDLKGFLGFGLYQMGDRTVTYFSINVLNLIIGKFLGPDVLGLYSMAYQLIITPILRVSSVIITVSFPVFSRMQNLNGLLKEGYLTMSRFISFTICPILLIVVVTAPLFVPNFFGARWVSAIPLIQILSIEAIIKSLMTTAVPTYLAKGMADFGFRWNFIVAVMNSIVFYLLAGYGIIPLTLSFVFLSFAQFIVLQMIMDTLLDLKLSVYADSLFRQILISVAMAIILYLTYAVISTFGVDPAQLFLILVIFGLALYLAMNLAFNGDYIMELKRLVATSRSS